MNKIILVAMLAFVFALSSVAEAASSSKDASVDDLLQTFSQGCQLGPWTQSALKRSQALTALLESMRKRASCQGLEGTIAAAQGLQTEIEKMVDDGSFSRERMWNEVVDDLALSLQNPYLSPDIRASLLGDYNYARFQLTQARAEVNSRLDPGGRANVARGVGQVRRYMGVLMSEMSALSACYADNPTVGLQIGTHILGIGGSFLPGLLGLGLQSVAQMIEATIVYARTIPISRAIYESRRARMPIALRCGMEAISREYCKARDAYTLAQLPRLDESGHVDPFYRGVDLLERKMPILYEWLDKVVNGVQPVDQDHATRIDEQFRRVNRANSMRRLSEGVLNEASKRIDRGDERERVIKDAIRNLVTDVFYMDMGGGVRPRPDSPFTESVYTFIKEITDSSQTWGSESWTQYLERLDLSSFQLHQLKSNLFGPQGLFTERYEEVIREFNETVNVDDATLVRSATATSTHQVSALGSLRRMHKFLNLYSYSSRPELAAQEKLLVKDLAERGRSVMDVLAAPNATDDVNVDPVTQLTPAQNVIQTVFNTFDLENNNVFLPGRASRLVRDDLTNRVCKDEAPDEVDEILMQAGSDVHLTLMQANLTPYQVAKDTADARYISLSSLRQFRDFFAKNLAWAVEDLHELIEETGERDEQYSPNKEVLAHLCVLTLITGKKWPKQIRRSYCDGLELYSPQAGLRLSFDRLRKKMATRPLSDRICLYEDFSRADRMAYLLQQRRSNGWQCPHKSQETHLTPWQDFVDQL